MLIYFFSDRNYVRSGFYAHYSVSACPHNCSGHGECLSDVHQCRCFAGYTGSACEQPLCSDACDRHGGRCSDQSFTCECPPGRRGYDCGLSLDQSDVSNAGTWSQVVLLNHGTYRPRAGHAGAVVDDCLFVFGGTTLNSVLDDLVSFCVANSSSWQIVSRSHPWPTARHSHAMCAVSRRLFMFGGVLDNGSTSDQLWVYDVDVTRWRLFGSLAAVNPPALSGHTLTAVNDGWLYLVGGRTSDGRFSSTVYILSLDEVVWQRVASRGGREAHHRLAGRHSRVI